MPTVHREAGFQFRIFPNDHGPPHVHAVKAGGSARFILGKGTLPPRLDRVHALKDNEVVRAVRIVRRERAKLIGAWEAIHGETDSDR